MDILHFKVPKQNLKFEIRYKMKTALGRKSWTLVVLSICNIFIVAEAVAPSLRRSYLRHLPPAVPLAPLVDSHRSALFASPRYDMRHEIKSSVGKSLDSSPVLVLNADYQVLSHEPLSLWNWQDALRAVLSDKANVVSEYDLVIRSVSTSVMLPSVIALKKFQRKAEKPPMLCRKFLLLRDSHTCQYCGGYFPPDKLSMDHMTPRSRGGKLTWDNTVCACIACNSKKVHTHIRSLSE